VNLLEMTGSPIVPRCDKPASQLTEIGAECLDRACLEAERRFCGNTGETLNDKPVVKDDHAMYLKFC
jgi:hypothetical protein